MVEASLFLKFNRRVEPAAQQRVRAFAAAALTHGFATLRSPRCQRHLGIDDRSQGTADVAHRRATQRKLEGDSSIHADATGDGWAIERPLPTALNSRTRPTVAFHFSSRRAGSRRSRAVRTSA